MRKMVKKYKLILGIDSTLANSVNLYLQDGWDLYGPTFDTGNTEIVPIGSGKHDFKTAQLAQAVVKKIYAKEKG